MSNSTVTMTEYGTIITDVGAAKLAACVLNGTKLNITHAAVGDGGGTPYKPTAEQTGLVNECWRGRIASSRINPANDRVIDVTYIIPAEVGGFIIRESAIIDADGDTIAICNTPDAQKVANTEGVSFPIKMVMHIIVTDASAVEVTISSSLDGVSHEELDAALQRFAAEVGSVVSVDITIPAANWNPVDETTQISEKYPYVADVEVAGCLKTHIPMLTVHHQSQEIAVQAGVNSTAETLDGIFRIWAAKVPTEDIFGTLTLLSQSLAGNSVQGLSLTDRLTGSTYDVYVDDSKLTMSEVF